MLPVSDVGGFICVKVLRVDGVPGHITCPYIRMTLQPHQKVSRTAEANVNDGHGLPLEWRTQEPVMLELVGDCVLDDRFTDLAAAQQAGALATMLPCPHVKLELVSKGGRAQCYCSVPVLPLVKSSSSRATPQQDDGPEMLSVGAIWERTIPLLTPKGDNLHSNIRLLLQFMPHASPITTDDRLFRNSHRYQRQLRESRKAAMIAAFGPVATFAPAAQSGNIKIQLVEVRNLVSSQQFNSSTYAEDFDDGLGRSTSGQLCIELTMRQSGTVHQFATRNEWGREVVLPTTDVALETLQIRLLDSNSADISEASVLGNYLLQAAGHDGTVEAWVQLLGCRKSKAQKLQEKQLRVRQGQVIKKPKDQRRQTEEMHASEAAEHRGEILLRMKFEDEHSKEDDLERLIAQVLQPQGIKQYPGSSRQSLSGLGDSAGQQTHLTAALTENTLPHGMGMESSNSAAEHQKSGTRGTRTPATVLEYQELCSDINRWKAKYRQEWGRDPDEHAKTTDPMVADKYERARQLKAEGRHKAPSIPISVVPPAEIPTAPVAQWRSGPGKVFVQVVAARGLQVLGQAPAETSARVHLRIDGHSRPTWEGDTSAASSSTNANELGFVWGDSFELPILWDPAQRALPQLSFRVVCGAMPYNMKEIAHSVVQLAPLLLQPGQILDTWVPLWAVQPTVTETSSTHRKAVDTLNRHLPPSNKMVQLDQTVEAEQTISVNTTSNGSAGLRVVIRYVTGMETSESTALPRPLIQSIRHSRPRGNLHVHLISARCAWKRRARGFVRCIMLPCGEPTSSQPVHDEQDLLCQAKAKQSNRNSQAAVESPGVATGIPGMNFMELTSGSLGSGVLRWNEHFALEVNHQVDGATPMLRMELWEEVVEQREKVDQQNQEDACPTIPSTSKRLVAYVVVPMCQFIMQQYHVCDRWWPLANASPTAEFSSNNSNSSSSRANRLANTKLGELHASLDFMPSETGLQSSAESESKVPFKEKAEDVLCIEVLEGQNIFTHGWLGCTDPVVEVELLGHHKEVEKEIAAGGSHPPLRVLGSARTTPPVSGNIHPQWAQRLEIALPHEYRLSSNKPSSATGGSKAASSSPLLRVSLYNTNCVRAKAAGLNVIGRTQFCLPSGVLSRGAVRERWLQLNSNNDQVHPSGSEEQQKSKICLRFYRGRGTTEEGAGKVLSKESVSSNAAALGMSGGKLHVEIQRTSRLPISVNSPVVQLRVLNEHQRKIKDLAVKRACKQYLQENQADREALSDKSEFLRGRRHLQRSKTTNEDPKAGIPLSLIAEMTQKAEDSGGFADIANAALMDVVKGKVSAGAVLPVPSTKTAAGSISADNEDADVDFGMRSTRAMGTPESEPQWCETLVMDLPKRRHGQRGGFVEVLVMDSEPEERRGGSSKPTSDVADASSMTAAPMVVGRAVVPLDTYLCAPAQLLQDSFPLQALVAPMSELPTAAAHDSAAEATTGGQIDLAIRYSPLVSGRIRVQVEQAEGLLASRAGAASDGMPRRLESKRVGRGGFTNGGIEPFVKVQLKGANSESLYTSVATSNSTVAILSGKARPSACTSADSDCATWSHEMFLDYSNASESCVPLLQLQVFDDRPVLHNFLGNVALPLMPYIEAAGKEFKQQWFVLGSQRDSSVNTMQSRRWSRQGSLVGGRGRGTAGRICVTIQFLPGRLPAAGLGGRRDNAAKPSLAGEVIIPSSTLESCLHTSQHLKRLFYSLDREGTGRVSKKQLKRVLLAGDTVLESFLGITVSSAQLLDMLTGWRPGGEQPSEAISRLFGDMDADADADIVWEEFIAYVQNKQQHIMWLDRNHDSGEQEEQLNADAGLIVAAPEMTKEVAQAVVSRHQVNMARIAELEGLLALSKGELQEVKEKSESQTKQLRTLHWELDKVQGSGSRSRRRMKKRPEKEQNRSLSEDTRVTINTKLIKTDVYSADVSADNENERRQVAEYTTHKDWLSQGKAQVQGLENEHLQQEVTLLRKRVLELEREAKQAGTRSRQQETVSRREKLREDNLMKEAELLGGRNSKSSSNDVLLFSVDTDYLHVAAEQGSKGSSLMDLREQVMELTLVNKQLRQSRSTAIKAQQVAEEKMKEHHEGRVKAEDALADTLGARQNEIPQTAAEIIAAAAHADACAARLESSTLRDKHEKELEAVLEHSRLLQRKLERKNDRAAKLKEELRESQLSNSSLQERNLLLHEQLEKALDELFGFKREKTQEVHEAQFKAGELRRERDRQQAVLRIRQQRRSELISAAVTCQRRQRLRTDNREKQRWLEKRHQAAVLLQSAQRGHASRAEFLRKRNRDRAARTIQAHTRDRSANAYYQTRRRAAKDIQKAFRIAREHKQKIALTTSAVQVIQALFRGKKGRQEWAARARKRDAEIATRRQRLVDLLDAWVLGMRHRQEDPIEKYQEAAMCIQGLLRGKWGRDAIVNRQQEADQLAYQRAEEDDASRCLTRVFKPKARRMAERTRAASTIQAHVRSNQGGKLNSQTDELVDSSDASPPANGGDHTTIVEPETQALTSKLASMSKQLDLSPRDQDKATDLQKNMDKMVLGLDLDTKAVVEDANKALTADDMLNLSDENKKVFTNILRDLSHPAAQYLLQEMQTKSEVEGEMLLEKLSHKTPNELQELVQEATGGEKTKKVVQASSTSEVQRSEAQNIPIDEKPIQQTLDLTSPTLWQDETLKLIENEDRPVVLELLQKLGAKQQDQLLEVIHSHEDPAALVRILLQVSEEEDGIAGVESMLSMSMDTDAAILIQSLVRGHQIRSQVPVKGALNVNWAVEYTEQSSGGSAAADGNQWLPGMAAVYHANEDLVTVKVDNYTTQVPASDPLRLRLIKMLEGNSAPSIEAYHALCQGRTELKEAAEDELHRSVVEDKLQEAQKHAEEEKRVGLADASEEYPKLPPESLHQLVSFSEHLARANESDYEWFRQHLRDKYVSNIDDAAAMISEFYQILEEGNEEGLLAEIGFQREFPHWQNTLPQLNSNLVSQVLRVSMTLPQEGKEKLKMLMEKKTEQDASRILQVMKGMDKDALLKLTQSAPAPNKSGHADSSAQEDGHNIAGSKNQQEKVNAATKIQAISRGKTDRAKVQAMKKQSGN